MAAINKCMTVFYICFTIIFYLKKGILMLNRFRGWPVVAGLLLGLVLSGCSGIPLSALPKLMQLSTELAEAHPAEFMVALQVDAQIGRASCRERVSSPV